MTEIDALIAGFGGGCLGGLAIAIGVVANIKQVYDKKIMMLRMQIIGLQAIAGINGDSDD
jgi:hypothetical protein